MSLVRRVTQPLVKALKSETSPVTLARSVATGIVLGVCPVFGLPILVSSIVVVRYKLNAPLVASVQLTVGAVALPVVVAFAHAGAAILGTTSDASPGALSAALRSGPISAARTLSTVLAHALVAWLLVAPALFLVCMRAVLMALSARRGARPAAKRAPAAVASRRGGTRRDEELVTPRKASARPASRRASGGHVP